MPTEEDLPTTQSGSPKTTHSAEEAMFMWETHGKVVPVMEKDQELFQLYQIGKEQRDFHITEWLLGVKQRLFIPEEFYGVLGMVSPQEFRGVFGRDLDLHLLSIQVLALQEEIRFYEDLLRLEDNGSTCRKNLIERKENERSKFYPCLPDRWLSMVERFFATVTKRTFT